MKLAFQVSTSPGVLKATTKSQRMEIIKQALRETLNNRAKQGKEITLEGEQGLQLTVDWVKKFIVFVTQAEAEDWLPVFC